MYIIVLRGESTLGEMTGYLQKNSNKVIKKNTKSDSKSLLQYIIKNKALYLMLLPSIILLTTLKYLPIFWNVIAFQDYQMGDGLKGILTSPWVGFKHFNYAFFESLDFWLIFKNTLVLGALQIVWGFPAPLILAILMNEIRVTWFKKVTQTIVYLPHFISWVVIAGMVQLLLAPDGGAINTIIKSFGGEPIAFLQLNEWWRTVFISAGIYKEVGFGTVIYLAALAGVNEELYESAAIDGANRFKMITKITLPSIIPTIIVLLILRVGSIISINFEQVLLLYNSLVYDVSDVIQTYVYRTGIQAGRFSYATAINLFQSVIALTLVFATNKISKKFGEGGLW